VLTRGYLAASRRGLKPGARTATMRRTRSPLRRFAAVALGKVHLLRPVVRLRERVVAARAPAVALGLVDGPPLPPARLRVLVDGHGDPERFVQAGVVGAEVIRRSLTDAGVALDSVGSLLDFRLRASGSPVERSPCSRDTRL